MNADMISEEDSYTESIFTKDSGAMKKGAHMEISRKRQENGSPSARYRTFLVCSRVGPDTFSDQAIPKMDVLLGAKMS